MNPVPKYPIKFAWTIAKLLFLKEVKENMFYLTRKQRQQQQQQQYLQHKQEQQQ